MWVSAMVGASLRLSCSCYAVTSREWSLIGDALSHSVVPCGGGLYVGLPFALGAVFGGRTYAGGGRCCFLSGRSRPKVDVITASSLPRFFVGPLHACRLSPQCLVSTPDHHLWADSLHRPRKTSCAAIHCVVSPGPLAAAEMERLMVLPSLRKITRGSIGCGRSLLKVVFLLLPVGAVGGRDE